MPVSDHFMQIDGIKGESKRKGAEDQIEVLQYQWMIENATNPMIGTGSGVGRAVPGLFMFSHGYDKASPILAKFCASGKHIDNAKLSSAKAGEGQKVFLTVTMKQVMVTSVSLAALPSGEIVENVAISYGSVEFEYSQQDEKGATAGGVKWAINVKTLEVT
ncbi:Hcp family type VI secretion system effector [Paraburkholderia flagellata]|uniref:Hcp family type VI secretion system effector n=1 Tax=Paraburkholderia flagellata TaxID=2883241 RepID=UPI001F2D1AE2|nr:type VI secretion system tube protein Hcp [Paraburkholderia flagellata]